MPNDLDLSLPERKAPQSRMPRGLAALMVLVLLVSAANLVVVLRGAPGDARGARAAADLPLAEAKQIALKLEKRGLTDPAVRAWEEVLGRPRLDPAARAKIWYRVGKLHQEADAPAQALAAFYRAETLGLDADLADELGRRIQDCLERAGKFAALRYELAERVGMEDDEAGETVVAEIGSRRITLAELDQRIEAEIERQLDRLAAVLPEDQRQERKQALLSRLASGPGRQRMLEQFVLEEILVRKARDQKLHEDPAVRERLRAAERQVLAGALMDATVRERIHITAGDLETYYQAHKADYREPAKAKISHILVADQDAARALIQKLQEGADFAALAREHSQDAATKAEGGAVAGWVHKGAPLPGLGESETAQEAIFRTNAGSVVSEPVTTDQGVHVLRVRERQPGRQQPMEEVQPRIYQELRRQKEAEVRQQLFSRLKDEYDVVVHHSALGADSQGEASADAPPPPPPGRGKVNLVAPKDKTP